VVLVGSSDPLRKSCPIDDLVDGRSDLGSGESVHLSGKRTARIPHGWKVFESHLHPACSWLFGCLQHKGRWCITYHEIRAAQDGLEERFARIQLCLNHSMNCGSIVSAFSAALRLSAIHWDPR